MIYTRARERYWRKQGILEPNGSGPLKWETYIAVKEFQNGRCAVCDKIFFVGDKRGDTADHDHLTGLFRGVLCGGRRGCNWRFVGKVERFKKLKIVQKSGEEAALSYLSSPPAKRWLESSSSS